jgi:hypothetical protein
MHDVSFLPTDLPALIRLIEQDALALIASMPGGALRLALLASELRRGMVR